MDQSTELQTNEATPPEEEGARVLDTTGDGYLFDVESGEVVGFDPQLAMPEGAKPERFEVRSPEAADWVLSLRGDLESQIFGIEERLRSITRHLGAQVAQRRAKLRFLSYRFDAELEAQARRELEGSRLKTVTYAHGKVAFRSSKGSTEITDAGEATKFALEWKPEAVKYSVNVTGLQQAIDAYREANDEEPDTSRFAKFQGPSEKVSITTGIGKESS